MFATVKHIGMDPYVGYAIIVEVRDGDEIQIYRRDYRLGVSEYRHGIDDKGDPRRALGEALEELGRALQAGHGHPLVVFRNPRPSP